jgi:hypothetical protein
MGLVARILRIAGVPCVLDIGSHADTILAEPRRVAGGRHWTVRVVRRRFGTHEEIWIGPADDDGHGLRVRPGSDERRLAALAIAQSLRADPRSPLTAGEADAAGLADGLDHD